MRKHASNGSREFLVINKTKFLYLVPQVSLHDGRLWSWGYLYYKSRSAKVHPEKSTAILAMPLLGQESVEIKNEEGFLHIQHCMRDNRIVAKDR